MPKIVLVETVSTFRHMYAVAVKDDEPIEYALDDVTDYDTGFENGLNEFAQNHVGEDIFSYREITEDEYLKIFDKENDYLKEWTTEQKKQYIYKGEE
jgi:hypothetical protein